MFYSLCPSQDSFHHPPLLLPGVCCVSTCSRSDVLIWMSHANFVPTDLVCGRANRQRRREVVSEGDGEDDDQEERLSQQQAGTFCVCFDVMRVMLLGLFFLLLLFYLDHISAVFSFLSIIILLLF